MTLYWIFILSGFAGLIYQSVWSHYLGLFVGHAAYAQALVLAIFMGGMSWGAMLASRRTEQLVSPVRGYAWVEAIIGVSALLFHAVFSQSMSLSHDTLLPLAGDGILSALVPWAISVILILPQSVLLGMTFPLISAGIMRAHPLQGGKVLGTLYFSNSIGAACGVLVTTFALIPHWGLRGALIVAGVLNLMVAVAAFVISRSGPATASSGHAPVVTSLPQDRSTAGVSPGLTTPLLRGILLATCVSGAASFVYEVVWIRMIGLVVGSTLHAFELMLASFILGLALGGWWIRRPADSSGSPMRLVGLMQICMGIAALASLFVYRHAFDVTGDLMQALSPTAAGYTLYNTGTAIMAIFIMLPAAFFAGTTLPLFTLILLRHGHGEKAIGKVYAWNSLGAIIGVVLAIHVLIPAIGLHLSLVAAALIDMLVGVIILRSIVVNQRQSMASLVLLLACCLLAGLAAQHGAVDIRTLVSGVYRSGQPTLDARREVLFYRDGKTASISVDRSQQDVAISTNGKVDAAISIIEGSPAPDEPTMVMLGALPLAYAPEPRRAAVIGFGSGLSTHTLLADPRLEKVDTIEIEQAMLEGAKAFTPRNQRAYDDPRSHVVIDDAKSFFARQQSRYDIIVAEPSNPWIAGVGNLFSAEFYRFVPRFMSPDGVFVQWLQLYEINEELVGSVLAGLTPAFADYHAYLSNTSDLIIVASMRPLPTDPDLGALFKGALATELRLAGLAATEDLQARRIADGRLLRTLSSLYGTRINSDYFPVLSLEAPQARFRRQSADQIVAMNVLDVPLLETLGVVAPVPTSHPIRLDYLSPRLTVTADMRQQLALMQTSTVTPASLTLPGPLSRDTGDRILAWYSRMRRCEVWTPEDTGHAVDAFLESTRMLTSIPADALADVYSTHVAPLCGALPEDYGVLLSLADAAGRRDAAAQLRLASGWFETLDQQDPVYRRADSWVYFMLQSALVRLHRYEDVLAVEERWGSRVPANDQRGAARQVMLNWVWLSLQNSGPGQGVPTTRPGHFPNARLRLD